MRKILFIAMLTVAPCFSQTHKYFVYWEQKTADTLKYSCRFMPDSIPAKVFLNNIPKTSGYMLRTTKFKTTDVIFSTSIPRHK